VRLKDVAQNFGRKKNKVEGKASGGEEGNVAGERLSVLVSKDSINGAMRTRAKREAEAADKENESIGGAAEGNESEWEDVVSQRSSWVGLRETKEETPQSTFSGKAFI
jgi:hypothetical protein